MDRLKMMKENLISCVQTQMGDIKNVDTKELGEAVDMIKDLEEAIYYCTVTEAMKKAEKEENNNIHTQERYYYTPYFKNLPEDKMVYNYFRDIDRDYGKMYYSGTTRTGNGSSNGMEDNPSYYTTHYDYMNPMEWHDSREGRSPLSRKSYLESKELNKDKNTQMKELEKYMRELSQDITEMIKDATPEERAMLHQKIITLAEKI